MFSHDFYITAITKKSDVYHKLSYVYLKNLINICIENDKRHRSKSGAKPYNPYNNHDNLLFNKVEFL